MNYVIIDVREPNEFAAGNVAGAINIPLSSLVKHASDNLDVPKNAKIIVYCNSGNRSGVAMKILQDLGYTDVTNGINKAQVKARI